MAPNWTEIATFATQTLFLFLAGIWAFHRWVVPDRRSPGFAISVARGLGIDPIWTDSGIVIRVELRNNRPHPIVFGRVFAFPEPSEGETPIRLDKDGQPVFATDFSERAVLLTAGDRLNVDSVVAFDSSPIPAVAGVATIVIFAESACWQRSLVGPWRRAKSGVSLIKFRFAAPSSDSLSDAGSDPNASRPA